MDFAHLIQFEKRKKADGLVIPFWKEKQKIQIAFPLKSEILHQLEAVLSTGDFTAKEGEVLYFYGKGQPEQRLILLGLGVKNKFSLESLRHSYGNLTKSCLVKKLQTLNLLIPQQDLLDEHDLLRGMAEGLLLPNYTFTRLKHQELDEVEKILQKITWIGPQKRVVEQVQKALTICEGVYYARNLINGNADEVTPQYLARCAKTIAKECHSIKTTVLDKKQIEKEKMGLLLAVNRGSDLDPTFIIMEYRGSPNKSDHFILIGKGVTYDTGGLNLKPTGGMETMKCDMAGAAACLAVILIASELKLKVNLTVVVPSTENGIDAKSFKPGDVYTGYAGRTVEMVNSDAEGRLILADALAYAVKKLNPTCIIDIATLTGAIEIALGSEATGLMSTSDELAEDLQKAGDMTYERLWRMPLYDEYKERLKSDIADIKSWNGRSGSACVAATFLRFFVPESIPWAHLDIAGTAYVTEAKKYLPRNAVGIGVRLLIEFLEQRQNSTKPKPKQAKRIKST